MGAKISIIKIANIAAKSGTNLLKYKPTILYQYQQLKSTMEILVQKVYPKFHLHSMPIKLLSHIRMLNATTTITSVKMRLVLDLRLPFAFVINIIG